MTNIKSTDPVPIAQVPKFYWDNHPLIDGRPVVRFPEFIKITGVGRSRSYDKWNEKSPFKDPDYPKGFPLYDSPRSPKVFWVHEALAWVKARSDKHRNQSQDCNK